MVEARFSRKGRAAVGQRIAAVSLRRTGSKPCGACAKTQKMTP